MGYLSIRNLPDRIERKIVQEAKRRHISKTEVVIELLDRGIRQSSQSKKKKSVREWAGRLSQKDLNLVLKASKEQRVIDPEIWS